MILTKLRAKFGQFAPQVWLTIAGCVLASESFAQNKATIQGEGPKRTSNGLVIKSSGSVQTPLIKAPARFKTPTAAQVKSIQQNEASRAQQNERRATTLRSQKKPDAATGVGPSPARTQKTGKGG